MSVQSLPSAYLPATSQLTQPLQSRSSDDPQIAQQNVSASQEDKVSLSAGGRLLSQLPPLFSEEIEADGVITLDELRSFFQEKTAAFQSELRDSLNAAGIDPTKTLELTTDSSGNVRVANDHPDKEKIEALFAEDPERAGDFRQISATGSLLKAAEEYAEFAADYAEDPQAAVAKHWELFSRIKDEYVLRLSGEEASWVKRS
jgi:hypothetical protein